MTYYVRTFHEQHCAGDLVYLIPTTSKFHLTRTSLWGKLDHDDVSVSQTSLTRYLHACEEVNRADPVLKWYFLEYGYVVLTFADSPSAIETVLQKMNRRDNRVLSDRIQIIANICGLTRKLKTTSLNNPTQSYSTCLLALTMANTWPDPAERALQYRAFGDAFMGGDIEGALKELTDACAQRSDPWRLPNYR